MNTTNQQIIDYVKANFGAFNNSLANQIDLILNNLLTVKCSIPYSVTFPYTILGATISNNSNRSLNLVIIVPNLFRLCYIQPKVYIPNICPIFDDKNINTKYIPLLLNSKIIKSFLYYGFSTNIYKYDSSRKISNNFITDKLKIILSSKFKTNYGFYTSATEIFALIYPDDSLLVQILKFNVKINDAITSYANNSVIPNFVIPWRATGECLCTSGDINFTSVIEIDKVLTRLDLLTINNFNVNDRSKYYGISVLAEISTNTIISKNSIYQIINNAQNVYTDVLEQIEYFILNKEYCLKDYMRPSNIPTLLEYYENYASNQENIDKNYSYYQDL